MEIHARTSGPLAPGGFTTVSGKAGDLPVHWIGDEKRAGELEQQFTEASRLLRLLLRNAYTLEGLTLRENSEAYGLIETELETEKVCWMCRENSKTVADTGLCRRHNRFALRTRN